jgi:colicin import membrane protein
VRPTDDVESRSGVDVEVVRSLVRTVQEQASDLSQELRDLPSRYSAQWQVDVAAGYATAAANAYSALRPRPSSWPSVRTTDAEVIKSVTTMLGEHPWRR